MARVSGTITLAAPQHQVWRQISDPFELPKWWPKVVRVESHSSDSFTEVLTTEKGRDVRADFKIVATDAPHHWSFVQELEDSPFEAVLRSARTTVTLEDAGNGATTLSLTVERRLRGVGRFGGPMMKKAAKTQLTHALERLGEIHGRLD